MPVLTEPGSVTSLYLLARLAGCINPIEGETDGQFECAAGFFLTATRRRTDAESDEVVVKCRAREETAEIGQILFDPKR